MKERLEYLSGVWRDGGMTDQEAAELNALLRSSETARLIFRKESQFHGWLHASAMVLAVAQSEKKPTVSPFSAMYPLPHLGHAWPSTVTAAVGLLIGVFCMSMAWAFASPRMIATAERLLSLTNGGFESSEGLIPNGFPKQAGVWSGDSAASVENAFYPGGEGRRMLQFLEPGHDSSDPGGRAIACDVFQIVDLRPLRSQINQGKEITLECSASFLDARPQVGIPITFICQMFLFAGSPDDMQSVWPATLGDALASGKTFHETAGGTSASWSKLITRCLVPGQADFAVVQLAARPNIRPSKIESVFVDDVQLTLKTQPTLPLRVVLD